MKKELTLQLFARYLTCAYRAEGRLYMRIAPEDQPNFHEKLSHALEERRSLLEALYLIDFDIKIANRCSVEICSMINYLQKNNLVKSDSNEQSLKINISIVEARYCLQEIPHEMYEILAEIVHVLCGPIISQSA